MSKKTRINPNQIILQATETAQPAIEASEEGAINMAKDPNSVVEYAITRTAKALADSDTITLGKLKDLFKVTTIGTTNATPVYNGTICTNSLLKPQGQYSAEYSYYFAYNSIFFMFFLRTLKFVDFKPKRSGENFNTFWLKLDTSDPLLSDIITVSKKYAPFMFQASFSRSLLLQGSSNKGISIFTSMPYYGDLDGSPTFAPCYALNPVVSYDNFYDTNDSLYDFTSGLMWLDIPSYIISSKFVI